MSHANRVDVETFHALQGVKAALQNAYEWVSGMHHTPSREERRCAYGIALELLAAQIDRAGERICECAAYTAEYKAERATGRTTQPRHLSTCSAHVDHSHPLPQIRVLLGDDR